VRVVAAVVETLETLVLALFPEEPVKQVAVMAVTRLLAVESVFQVNKVLVLDLRQVQTRVVAAVAVVSLPPKRVVIVILAAATEALASLSSKCLTPILQPSLVA
jgi:hypothetical protein